MGRRLPAESDKLYALTNYCIQGCAADIFKQTLVQLDRAGLADRMVLPVHDEAVFDVPAEEADDFAVEAVRVFESHSAATISA
jgi:DNA polymerase I